MKTVLKKLWDFRNRSFKISVEDATSNQTKHTLRDVFIIGTCALFGTALTQYFSTRNKV